MYRLRHSRYIQLLHRAQLVKSAKKKQPRTSFHCCHFLVVRSHERTTKMSRRTSIPGDAPFSFKATAETHRKSASGIICIPTKLDLCAALSFLAKLGLPDWRRTAFLFSFFFFPPRPLSVSFSRARSKQVSLVQSIYTSRSLAFWNIFTTTRKNWRSKTQQSFL